jgi:hypothetical protein
VVVAATIVVMPVPVRTVVVVAALVIVAIRRDFLAVVVSMIVIVVGVAERRPLGRVCMDVVVAVLVVVIMPCRMLCVAPFLLVLPGHDDPLCRVAQAARRLRLDTLAGSSALRVACIPAPASPCRTAHAIESDTGVHPAPFALRRRAML